MNEKTRFLQICDHFDFGGNVVGCAAFGSGHINDTYRVTCSIGTEETHYVLQKINTAVFRHPGEVMENIRRVTDWLRKKKLSMGRDADREVLSIVPAKDGSDGLWLDDEYWRVYRFIENAVAYDQTEDEQVFRESAAAFGQFQYLLSDFPAHLLHETIPHFHHTPLRLLAFTDAVSEDPCARAGGAAGEIRFLQEHAGLADVLCSRLEAGTLPLRVTHNDTKLNNVMIDKATGRAVCVIDLDTVMPGLSATDFGDAIRFGASTAREDEPDLDKVRFDLSRYSSYTRGFLEGCAGALTPEEYEMLPWGALVITYEQALRFLGDYLLGDLYYKISFPQHNLIRARTQIRLLEQMLQHFGEMQSVVKRWSETIKQ